MTTSDIAKELETTVQAVRILAQKGKLPFIKVIENEKENSYYAWWELYELWKEGKL